MFVFGDIFVVGCLYIDFRNYVVGCDKNFFFRVNDVVWIEICIDDFVCKKLIYMVLCCVLV